MIVQFAAHANSAGVLTDATDRSADASFGGLDWVIARTQRWFTVAGALSIAILLPVGRLLFEREAVAASVPYGWPWLVVTVCLGCYLAMVPLLCILEGAGALRRVQRMRLVQAVAMALTLWVLVPSAGGLVGVAGASVAQV